jgi:hypothetical protein
VQRLQSLLRSIGLQQGSRQRLSRARTSKGKLQGKSGIETKSRVKIHEHGQADPLRKRSGQAHW